jgi:hypothetical protein
MQISIRYQYLVRIYYLQSLNFTQLKQFFIDAKISLEDCENRRPCRFQSIIEAFFGHSLSLLSHFISFEIKGFMKLNKFWREVRMEGNSKIQSCIEIGHLASVFFQLLS